MASTPGINFASTGPLGPDIEHPPEWVAELLDFESEPFKFPPHSRPGPQVVSRERSDVTLVSAKLANARSMARPDFEGAVTQIYREIFKALLARPSPHPVRFWNHIPGLHDPMGPGLDRYMAFNAGRFRAMVAQYGNTDAVRRVLPTASGVGHSGHDLVIHCLAAAEPGRPIENPRQTPAYMYSRRFGPIPPCFSRASVASIGGRPVMLLAGTASIRGEESVHVGDLGGQLTETFLNLGILIRGIPTSAMAPVTPDGQTTRPPNAHELAPYLSRLNEVRIYHPRPTDDRIIRTAAESTFPNARSLQLLRADLCRSELLVEIEGVASLEDS
jgi:chorismate lyase/3-hydroxybenzoate synthase